MLRQDELSHVLKDLTAHKQVALPAWMKGSGVVHLFLEECGHLSDQNRTNHAGT